MDEDKDKCKNPDVCNRFKQGRNCCDKGEDHCQRSETCPRKKKYPNEPCCRTEKSTQVLEAQVVDLEAGCPETCPRKRKYPNAPCCESKTSAFRSQPEKQDSTQVLYMMPNFEPTPSEQEKFYDCLSESDVPDEGTPKCTRAAFDDPQAIRIALQRASDAAQKLLKNFDSCKDVARSQHQEPQICSANLEISAKLTSLGGSQENDIRCNPYRVRIDPITFKIPITFNVPGGPECPCQSDVNEPLLTATVARPQLSYSPDPGPKADSDRYIRNLIPPEDERPTTSRKANLELSTADDRDPNKSKFPIVTKIDPLISKGLAPKDKPSKDDAPLLYDSTVKRSEDKFDPRAKPSQTDASFLRDKAIKEGKILEPELSDDKLSPNAKQSQTDASYLKDKAIREGKIIKPEDTEDATTKQSQTELSYLRNKKTVTTSDMTVQANPDEADASSAAQYETGGQRSNLRPNKIHYPTNFRVKQSEKSEDKNLKICVCKDAFEGAESRSDHEVTLKEIFCRCTNMSSQKKNVDAVEDETETNKEEKDSCCQKSSQLSNKNRDEQKDDVVESCKMQTGLDGQKKRKLVATEKDVLVLSEKDIKIRGGFKPLNENAQFNESWFTYDDQSLINVHYAMSDTASLRQNASYKVVKKVSVHPNIYDDEQFMSCESSSDTSLTKPSSKKSSYQDDKSKPCTSVCSGENQKLKNKSASATTCYCSMDSSENDNSVPTSNMSKTSTSKQADNILCNISNVEPLSAERCGKCGKKQSSPNIRSVSVQRCDICGKKSKQSIKKDIDQPSAACEKKQSNQSAKKDSDHACEICGKKKSKQSVKSDTGQPCDICGKKQSKQSVKKDTEQPCDICGKHRRNSKNSSEITDSDNVVEEEDTNVVCTKDDSDQNECMLSCHCSTDTLTCQDDPDAPCQTAQSRQDRIVLLLENLTDTERCPGPISEERATMVQQLFKEITFLLCQEPKNEEATEEDKMVRSQKLAKRKKQAQLQCCLSKMQEYIEECFLKGYSKPMHKITDTELYKIEPDPDFVYREGSDPCGEEWMEEGPGETEPDNALLGSCGCETALVKVDEYMEEEENECLPCKLLQQQQEEEESECVPCKLLQQLEEEEDLVCICDEYNKPCPSLCNCCHCRALRCQQECKTVATTLQSVMYDPACEMKYFIDSIIFDLDTMEKVLHAKDAKPKPERPVRRPNRALESFPVKITDVNDLGLTSLYIQWDIFDCCGIAGYEIYVDGHLTNRFYSPGHQSGVICDVNVNRMHQIVLRAQPVGEDFPGDSCTCTTVAKNEPNAAGGPGSSKPWLPSIYLYDPCLKVF